MSYSFERDATARHAAISKKLLLSSSALLAVLAITGTAGAQTVTELEGIVIESANRTPTDAAKVGSSVEVITERDLEKQSKTFLKDYLEQLPGVGFRQNGPPGTTAGMILRGVGSAYVKVLVDGIDISDPSGVQTTTHFEHLLVGDVSRIEVLKGSQSTLYGGDAVGGVISVETKKAMTPGFSQSGGAEYGRYNTYRGAYTAGYAANDGSNIAFTVQGIDTDGFSAVSAGTEDDGYRNLTISGRGRYHISDAVSVFFAARTLDARSQFDDTFSFADSDDFSDTVQHAGRAGVDISLLGGAFQNTFAVQGMQIERDFTYSWGNTFFNGDRIKAEYKGVLTFNDRLSLLAGADWEEIGLENADVSRATADIGGVYAQLMMEPIDGLVLTGGGRVDEHSAFGSFNTYRLTAAYLIPGTNTKLRASHGTGFRAPSLDELYGDYGGDWGAGPFQYGNPDLQPEESTSWDVGIEQSFFGERLRLGATYFEIDTDNLIQYVNTDWGAGTGCGFPGELCNINIAGVTERRGIEVSAAAIVTDGLVISAAYTYVDTETPDSVRLRYIPRHSLTVGFDLQPMDKVELNVVGTYVADTLHTSTPTVAAALDDYFLLSAKASYEFTPGWKAYVRGENLLDEDYETMLNYGTAGLSVYGGITMALPSN